MTDKDKALKELQNLVTRRDNLSKQIDDLVSVLRSPDMNGECEATWTEVAFALGVTRSAAQQKYRHTSWGGHGAQAT